MSSSVVSAARCSLTARARGDALAGTAPPARRFILLEVPGAWGPDLWSAASLRPDVAAALHAAVLATGSRLLLIRRPGAHPAGPDRPRSWGMVDTQLGATLWGSWRQDGDLLDVDWVVPAARAGERRRGEEQRPLALVCTHGRKDLCCAVEGRPVVAAAAADPAIDVWECSHLGGDRFAANLLWLPAGLLFGGLNALATAPVLAAARAGRVLLEHFRGRCGDPVLAQVAAWHLMRALGEDRPDQVVVEPGDPLPMPGGSRAEPHLAVVVRHADRRYRVDLAHRWTDPEHLTCQARSPARVRSYRLLADPEPL